MSTNAGRRLDRLFPALTPKERAILVLRAWKEDAKPDPQLLRSAHANDAHEYNRLIGLIEVARCELTQYATLLYLMTIELNTRFAWFLTATVWSDDLRPGPRRGEELCELLGDQVRTGLMLRWQELGALDVVLGEIAEEFDGEDGLQSRARAMIEEARTSLTQLRDDVSRYLGDVELAAPDQHHVLAVRRLLEQRSSP